MSDAPAGTTAPAPAAPSAPATEPAPSPLAAASEAIRKEWAASPPPSGEEGAAPSPAQAPEPEGQPRGEDGKFVKAEEPAAPEGEGEPEPEPQGDAPEGEPEPQVEGEPIVVALPGRHPHDAPVEIAVDDPEVAERLRQLNNGFMRGEEVRQERAALEQNWGQIAEVEESIQVDPVGFVHRQLPPEYAPRLALQILAADPKALEAVRKDLTELLTPATSRTKLAELKAEMYETREALAQVREARREGERHAQEVRSAVAAMIPPEYDAEQSGAFLREALNDLGDYAQRHGLDRLDPEQLPVLLAQRLQRAGINPVQAASRLAAATSRNSRKPTSPSGPPSAGRPSREPGPKAAAAQPARPTGKTFVQGEARRRAVATTPPAGAGAPRAPVAPPPGTTLKEATALARARRRS